MPLSTVDALVLLISFIVPISVIAQAAGQWDQCGGNFFNGPTTCVDGWRCVEQNEWYSQCLPAPMESEPEPAQNDDGNSADCLLEHENAIRSGTLLDFCDRCMSEGGANPLRSRCQFCFDACPSSTTSTSTIPTTSSTSSITTANTAPYVLGTYRGTNDEEGTNSCPSGYVVIDNKDECKLAAAFVFMGKEWKGKFKSSTYTGGCSHRRNHPSFTGVWFNPTLTGNYDGHAMTGQVAPLCRMAPYILGSYSGTNDEGMDNCPRGYESIADSSACEAASIYLRKEWRGSINLGNTYTGGCSHRLNHPRFTGVWFNPTLTGSYDGHAMIGQVAPLCMMAAPYALGSYSGPNDEGTDSCPIGYVMIDEKYECKLATASIFTREEWKGKFKSSTYVGGCSHRRNHPSFTGVWFNPTLTGNYDGHQMTGQVAPLCKRGGRRLSQDTGGTRSSLLLV